MTPASKLQSIKPGDRVRVTFEAVVLIRPGDDRLWISRDIHGNREFFEPIDSDSPTFQIERIEPPLAVGDRVRFGGFHGAIKAIDGTRAWVSYDDGSYGSPFMHDLVRIP